MNIDNQRMENAVTINIHLHIPISEISFRFARSGGHGGQNVNKVETKVELLFDVGASPSLTDSQRHHLMRKLGSRIDSSGVLRIIAQDSRSQWQNRVDAMERFVEMLREAMKPVKKRVKTKVPRSVKERRLEEKKRRSQTKQFRRGME
jgi:ribosome-associated protein